ncbi:MAG: hypothetical protein CL931_05230 [Deltaproteobacteria bacterium]|nr:hypothetical protein [Deltaproteobacteria bacterium]
MLRQALDILEADEDIQRGLYPEDMDPALAMSELYREAWHGVRRAFTPVLPRDAVDDLEAIGSGLDAAPPDWSRIRTRARAVRSVLPTLDRPSKPRAWPDQIAIGPNHLMVRGQLAED